MGFIRFWTMMAAVVLTALIVHIVAGAIIGDALYNALAPFCEAKPGATFNVNSQVSILASFLHYMVFVIVLGGGTRVVLYAARPDRNYTTTSRWR